MASVLDDPASRLYAGALLGKALSKQAGEVSGQEGPLESLNERRATLQAGIASGRLKPSALSPEDAGLLGSALSKKQNIPSGPLGFLGHFVENFGKGAGEFAESLQHVPQGLYVAGKGLGELIQGKPKTEVGLFSGLGKSIAHDFSSPRQIYEHPFNPLIDVAGVASGGAGAAVKGAAALSKGAEEGSALARVARLGATTGREARILSPSFTPENTEALAAAGIKPAEYAPAYSGSPFTKYAIQKPLDTSISKLAKLQRRFAPQTKPLDELRGEYLGRKLVNRAHATINSGANQALMENKPLKDLIQTAGEMYKPSHIKGEYEWEATVLHSAGINTLDKLDEYIEAVRRGDEDALDEIGGQQQLNKDLNEQQRKAIEYRTEQKYQDPRFRQLIEDPTNLMKQAAYHLRRVNILHAMQLDIDPVTSIDSAFGRVRALSSKTTEELAHELPPGLRGEFAMGLQGLRDKMVGEDFTQPSIDEIKKVAMHLPFGTMEERMSILERAVESFLKDHEGVSKLDSMHDPNYLQGNNLFEKVSTALSDELGVPQEQAQGFARGIMLGTPETEITPTYIPSFSGAGLKFGEKPDLLRTRVARTLGMAKFKPLEDLSGTAPNYMEIKRPFNPRTISAQTIGLSPSANYLKEADYGAFVRGYADLRPEGIIKLAATIQRDLVFNKLNPKLLERLAIKGDDGEPLWVSGRGQAIERMGHIFETHYEVVPVDIYRNYLGSEAGMIHRMGQMVETWKNESLSAEESLEKLEELSDEAAQEFVSGLSQAVASGNQKYLIIPRTYIKTLVDHTRLTEASNPVGRAMQSLIGRWKAAVLSYSPAWLLRTTSGHGLVALIDGTVNPNAWKAGKGFEGDRLILGDRPVLGEHMAALRPWANAGSEKILGNALPPGVNQGSIMHELGDVGQAAREAKLRTVPRAIQTGVHTTTNYQRRAIFLAKLHKLTKQRMDEANIIFDHPGGFWNPKNLDAVLDPEWQKTVLKYPDLIEHAFDQLSHASYTFGEMSPWERRFIKNGIPFLGWYKFISKFVWSMPINYPGRAAAIQQLGKIGDEDITKMGPIPPYLETALFFDHHNLNDARYINLYGLNPLGDVVNPEGRGGFGEGIMRLGQTSPFIQAGLSAFGINPVTGTTEEIDPSTGFEKGKYGEIINTKTGEVYPGPAPVHGLERGLGTFIRAFPEIRTLELLENKGNPTYPESIPIINNRVKPINPISRHGANLPEALQQEFGVQARSLDVGKYAANQLKKVTEARRKNPKTVARGKAKLSQ